MAKTAWSEKVERLKHQKTQKAVRIHVANELLTPDVSPEWSKPQNVPNMPGPAFQQRLRMSAAQT